MVTARVCRCGDRPDITGLTRHLDNYLVTFDLTSSFSVDEGSSYRMELMDASVPKIKDAALWADQTNRTLFVYGGRYPDKKTLVDGRTWTYGIPQKSWRVQQNSIQPTRLISGGGRPPPPPRTRQFM